MIIVYVAYVVYLEASLTMESGSRPMKVTIFSSRFSLFLFDGDTHDHTYVKELIQVTLTCGKIMPNKKEIV